MKQLGALFVAIAFSAGLNAQSPVPLGSAGSFAALAGSTVTNTGPTLVAGGDVGVSPGSAVTGFPPGIIVGGVIHAADTVAATAQSDLTAAYNDAAGRPTANIVSNDIGGQSFLPGVYRATTSLGITGTVTLNGNGNPNAVFIFQVGSTLTTAAGNSIVFLTNGARASNVFWQVGSSATLGTNTDFAGTILAQTSVTLTTGATLFGRALARTGAVTFDSNGVTNPGLAVVAPSPVPAPSSFLLVMSGMALVGLFRSRDRLAKAFKRN